MEQLLLFIIIAVLIGALVLLKKFSIMMCCKSEAYLSMTNTAVKILNAIPIVGLIFVPIMKLILVPSPQAIEEYKEKHSIK